MSPIIGRTPRQRFLYAIPDVYEQIVGPWEEHEKSWGALRARLDHIIQGKLIGVSMNISGKSRSDRYLARLQPAESEVWEVCSIVSPGIRIFGRFAARDHLVLFGWQYRRLLGGRDSDEFRIQIENCIEKWEAIFPTWQPLSGRRFDDYITDQAFLVGNP